jgi:hypothetical protein
MSFQPYPSGRNEMAQGPAGPAPRSVQNAVKLMYVGAGISALTLIIGLATIGSMKSAIQSAAVRNGKPLTATQLHAAETFGIALVIIIGLIGIGLWVWMARTNGAGKSWARVVATVLFALDTLSVLLGLARPNAIGTKIFDLLIWLVGLGAIVLLYQRESSAYFNAQSRK